MQTFPPSIDAKIEQRKANDSYRTLFDFSHHIDFFSNDYLGLAKWQSKSSAAEGATGSRLISGNSKRTEAIEAELAQFFNMPSALLFNSGYDANLGLFSSILQKGDTIVYDQLIHASIRDGIKLGNGTAYSFEHNNVGSLESKLKLCSGTVYVAVESIYSMDGDFGALQDISDLCERYGAYLIVDEAHAGGIVGEKGEGLCSELKIDNQIFAKVITFGKAYGSHGAVVLSNDKLRSYLINYARSFLYTTALSPQVQERIAAVIKHCAMAKSARESLNQNIAMFKSLMQEGKRDLLKSESPIQCVMQPGNTQAKELAAKIVAKGFAVKAILYPTVPKGQERLRFCIHSYNTETEIKNLVKELNG